MTKLKTLKDLTTDSSLIVGQTELKNRIKKEAIKWVKEEISLQGVSNWVLYGNDQLRRWMKRLNITEANLK